MIPCEPRTAPPTTRAFPAGFLWGAATSAFQIEGADSADGKGDSIWDVFCRKPGAIEGGDTAARACDHHRLWASDLDLARDLGFSAYRFSTAWTRVQPTGRGRPLAAGLDFYERLVDGCLERGLEPCLTIFHWDLPQALEEAGGWRSRDTAKHMGDLAEHLALRLGHRVRRWMTINEGPCIADNGYRTGFFAPGAREPEQVVRQCRHNVLLAHGHASRALRDVLGREAVDVGFVHNPYPHIPARAVPEDVEAAREAFRKATAWWLDPLWRGSYPPDELEALGPDAPVVLPGEMDLLADAPDSLGLNLYYALRVAAGEASPWKREEAARTDFDWTVEPDIAYWIPRWCHEIWSPKAIQITENGCAWEAGGLDDQSRLAYFRDHLLALARACSEGVPVDAYFAWSLLDNFEWASGFSKRFGLVHVDFATQERTPKASAKWFTRVCRENRVPEGGISLP